MPIQALLTDLDGVIRYWDPAHFTDVEAAHNLPPGTLPQTAFAADLLLPAITGQVTDTEWRSRIALRLQAEYPAIDAENVVQAWSDPAGEVVEPVLALIRQCRATIPVVLVTNATSRLPTDLVTLGIAEEFDHIINSSEVGIAKPDSAIFMAALSVVNLPAGAALFVDDTAANVDAAAQLGLQTHHYQSFVGFERLLKTYDLL